MYNNSDIVNRILINVPLNQLVNEVERRLGYNPYIDLHNSPTDEIFDITKPIVDLSGISYMELVVEATRLTADIYSGYMYVHDTTSLLNWFNQYYDYIYTDRWFNYMDEYLQDLEDNNLIHLNPETSDYTLADVPIEVYSFGKDKERLFVAMLTYLYLEFLLSNTELSYYFNIDNPDREYYYLDSYLDPELAYKLNQSFISSIDMAIIDYPVCLELSKVKR